METRRGPNDLFRVILILIGGGAITIPLIRSELGWTNPLIYVIWLAAVGFAHFMTRTGYVYWDDQTFSYRNASGLIDDLDGDLSTAQLVSAEFKLHSIGYIPISVLRVTDRTGEQAAINWPRSWDTSGWGPLVVAAIDRNRGHVDPRSGSSWILRLVSTMSDTPARDESETVRFEKRYRGKPVWQMPHTWLAIIWFAIIAVFAPLATLYLLIRDGAKAHDMALTGLVTLPLLIAFFTHQAAVWVGFGRSVSISPESFRFRHGFLARTVPWRALQSVRHTVRARPLQEHEDHLNFYLADGRQIRMPLDPWLYQGCTWGEDFIAGLRRSPAGRDPYLARELQALLGTPEAVSPAPRRDLLGIRHDHRSTTITDEKSSEPGILGLVAAAVGAIAVRAYLSADRLDALLVLLATSLLIGFAAWPLVSYRLGNWSLTVDETGFAFRMGWYRPARSWDAISLLDVETSSGSPVTIKMTGARTITVLDRASDRSWVQWLVREAELHGVPVTERARTAA